MCFQCLGEWVFFWFLNQLHFFCVFYPVYFLVAIVWMLLLVKFRNGICGSSNNYWQEFWTYWAFGVPSCVVVKCWRYRYKIRCLLMCCVCWRSHHLWEWNLVYRWSVVCSLLCLCLMLCSEVMLHIVVVSISWKL